MENGEWEVLWEGFNAEPGGKEHRSWIHTIKRGKIMYEKQSG